MKKFLNMKKWEEYKNKATAKEQFILQIPFSLNRYYFFQQLNKKIFRILKNHF